MQTKSTNNRKKFNTIHQKGLKMIELNLSKIREDYGSLAEFARKEEIRLPLIVAITKKKSDHFKSGSDAFKAFKIIKRLGYIKEKEIVA